MATEKKRYSRTVEPWEAFPNFPLMVMFSVSMVIASIVLIIAESLSK